MQPGLESTTLVLAMADDTSYGYAINNYRHCLQSATMVIRAMSLGEVTCLATSLLALPAILHLRASRERLRVSSGSTELAT